MPPAAKFSPPPVLQPKAEKKPDAKLPEWKPGGSGAVSPLQRLIDSKAAQAKLTIGEPNDKYEQEADAVAKDVVQRLHSPVSESPQPEADVQREPEMLQLKPLVQRVHAVGGVDASPDIENSINRAKGSGQPLDAGLQRSMGEAMGADFSGVRVHTDAQSDQLNQSIQAKAFTTGQDVFFRQGEYQPGSRGGQELIAHELTHVVQQSQAKVQRQADTLQRDTEDEKKQKETASVKAFLKAFHKSKTMKKEKAFTKDVKLSSCLSSGDVKYFRVKVIDKGLWDAFTLCCEKEFSLENINAMLILNATNGDSMEQMAAVAELFHPNIKDYQ